MTLPEYRYNGARSLVLLHERHLRDFLVTWKKAHAAHLTLPETRDPNYASMESLLRHVLRAARGYMVWCCDKLGLPDPQIEPPPAVEDIEERADAYLEHVLQRWATPLADVAEEGFESQDYEAPWKSRYCIDAMLEHAVMHPIRHQFQLETLLQRS